LRRVTAARILLDRLIDDAGVFPPARKPMDRAVADHRAAREGEHAWMFGRFLCPVSRLEEWRAAGPDADWLLGVVLDGDDWRADLATVEGFDGPGRIDAVELRLPAEPVQDVLDFVPDGADVFVEVPAAEPRALTAALEDLAATRRAGAKIRCGGLSADAFPTDDAVARFVTECRRLRLAFKATAGLHHPFRTRDDELGVLQHGFVNLLAATAAPEADTERIVAEEDPKAFELVEDAIGWRGNFGDAAEARASFTAFGSCSFDEPVEDLVSHGVLSAGSARA
jgi:hypothetical protein